jgi:hypothetical protein
MHQCIISTAEELRTVNPREKVNKVKRISD